MDANTMRNEFLLRYEGAQLKNRTFNDREISTFLTKATREIVKRRFIPDKNIKRKGFDSDTVRRAELAGLITAHKVYKKENSEFMIGTEDNGALRTPDLDQQVATPNTNNPVISDYGVFVEIPNEVLYIILETCSTKQANCVVDNVEVQEVSYIDYSDGITNYYKKPYKNLVWAMDWGSYTTSGTAGSAISVKGFTGTPTDTSVSPTITINTRRSRLLIPGKDWEILKYNLHYIKMPADIVVDIQSPEKQVDCELADFMHGEVVDYAVKLAAASIVPEPNKYEVGQIESSEDE